MFTDEQVTELVELLSSLSSSTKLYFGCDSQKRKGPDGKWYAHYATVLVVHMDGRKGCRIFSHIDKCLDYDAKKNKPSNRLMGEVYRVVSLYNQLQPWIDGYDVEIHLDISTNLKYGSSCVANQAAGYVLGATGVEPKLKPESWASSFGADGIGRNFHNRKVSDKTHKIKKRRAVG